MNEQALARIIGWLTIGVGLAVLAAPIRAARAFGIMQNQLLIRVLGVRDVAIGAALARGEHPARWLRARALSDGGDSLLVAQHALAGNTSRIRALLTIVFTGIWCVATLELARRVERSTATRALNTILR